MSRVKLRLHQRLGEPVPPLAIEGDQPLVGAALLRTALDVRPVEVFCLLDLALRFEDQPDLGAGAGLLDGLATEQHGEPARHGRVLGRRRFPLRCRFRLGAR